MMDVQSNCCTIAFLTLELTDFFLRFLHVDTGFSFDAEDAH